MITKLDIKGFKSIKEQSVSLSNINIFIGGNGVGKSNFISIFSLVRAIYEKNLSEYVIKKGGANSFLHFGKKYTQEILFDFYFGNLESDTNRFIVELQNNQDSLFIKSINTAFYNGKWFPEKYERNVLESNFKNIKTGQAYWVNDRLKEFEVYHFHDTGDDSLMKAYSNIDDNRFLKKDGSNLPAFLYYLKQTHPKYFIRIEKTISSIAPFFDSFNLSPSNLNPNLIKLEWKEKGSYESYFDAYNLSDGTLRFICLATLLMQPEPPKTIIIDEPELGLHPVAINKIASLIRKVSASSQLIISTQSLNLIDNFEPENIIVSERFENQTIFKRLSTDDLKYWIDEYSLGDIWGKNIFGGQPI
jgi:predicted ATPase